MSKIRNLSGTVEVDGTQYDWELLSEPSLTDGRGWKGMTVSLIGHDLPRQAIIEFPAPKSLMRGMPKRKTNLNDTIVARGVRAALAAGWEPETRGKTVYFDVDADGN